MLQARSGLQGMPESKQGKERQQRALFVQFTARASGSPISGLVIVRALRKAGWAVDVVFGEGGDYERNYRAEGCRVHILPHGLWLSAARWWQQLRCWGLDLRAALRFVRLMRQIQPDLVYINNVTGAAAAAAARWKNVPSVWHFRELFHDLGGEFHYPPIGGRLFVRYLIGQLATRVITVSNSVRVSVLGESKKHPATVLPNAVFSEFFEESRSSVDCRKLLALPQAVPLIGVPGTLRPVKGHLFFLEAARRALDEMPECHFAITGDGHPGYKNELRASVQMKLIESRVHFLGTLDDMAAFYRACDLICVPSRSEAQGRTVIEPMAIGTPVIGTSVGGIPEAIKHEETGLLVRFEDVENLANSILRLLKNPALSRLLTAQARRQAETDFHEARYGCRVLGVVQEAMGVNSRRL